MSGQLKETERVQSTGGPGRGPMHTGLVGGKATSFKASAIRFIRRMRPERARALWVIALAVLSVGLSALGPKLLGHATDLVFSGLIGARLPEGITKAEAVAAARARGEDRVADMMSAMDLTPGVGVDFGAVGEVL